ncbi:MAG: hypothetical protein AAF629_28005 [Chloroflexota bacterium]
MNLFVALLIAVTGFLLIIKLIASLAGRISEHFLTGHFRALESLLEDNRLPDAWANQLQKMAKNPSSFQVEAKPFLLKKIGRLRKHFEGSPFVESDETRALLLEELDEITARWESAALADILADYDLTKCEGNSERNL